MTIKFLRIYILSAAVFYSINACTVDNDLIDIPGSTMGTTYSVKIATDNISESATIKSEIDSILNEVNRQMSTYRKDSEISALNLAKAGVIIHVSNDFSEVLQKAFDISEKSGGAFDITVGPLINLWGFGPPGSAFEVP
ncbi:MAG: FAD:protein FMN transferase, partial [Ignavibacteriales bacterium]|nr:FAD:protein FMN transferase [Ignavibacteriales bacterium]